MMNKQKLRGRENSMKDCRMYVLIEGHKFRNQAGYVPVEQFGVNAFQKLDLGQGLNVSGACRDMVAWQLDGAALWHFGLNHEEYLTQEVEQLKSEVEDLKEDNLRLENIIATGDEWMGDGHSKTRAKQHRL